MSLINQMLQDLENRQAQKRGDARSNFADGLNSVPDYKTGRGFLNKRMMVYLSIFVVILMIILALKMGNKKPAAPLVVPAAATQVDTTTTPPPAVAPATPGTETTAAQPAENPYLTLSKQVGGLAEQTKSVAQSAAATIEQTESGGAQAPAQTSTQSTSAPVTNEPIIDVQDGGQTDLSVDAEIGPLQPAPVVFHPELMKIMVSTISKNKQTATFYMDSSFKYEFTEKNNNNQINVMFFNTTTADNILPTLEAISYITEVSFVKQQENITVTLTLGKGVMVSGLETNKTDTPQRLTITLNGPDVVQPTVSGAGEPEEKISEMSKVVKPPTEQEKLQLDYEDALNDLKQNKMDSAIQKMQAILDANPEHLVTRSDLMTLYFERRDYNNLQLLLNDALQMNPQYPPFIMMQARLFMLQKENDQALLIMGTISPDIKQYPDFYAILGTLEQQAGNYQVAAQTYLELIRIEPSEGRWWLGYGLALEALGKRNIALQAYEKAIATGSLPIDLIAFVRGRVDALGG